MDSDKHDAPVKKRRHLRKKRAATSSPSLSGNSGDGEHHCQEASEVKGVQFQSIKRRQGDNSMVFTTKKKSEDGEDVGTGFHTFASSGVDAKPQYLVNDATRTLDMGEDKRGAHTSRDIAGEDPGKEAKKVYRGMKGYKDYRDGFRREDEKSTTGKAHGPSKPSSNYRMSILVDYQPDVCKDYKETGYCGFGDSCKFLHDRGDYKAGWQLDRDWEEEQKARKERERQGWVDGDHSDDNEDSDDDMPFACFICRDPWADCSDPVVTTCGHYFCEQCALKHNAKTGKCFVCNEPTRGIFNVAHAILKREKARAKS